MLKLFIVLLIVNQQIMNKVFGGKTKNESAQPYEPLPFTLIKTRGGIKFPTHLLLKHTFLLFKKKKLFYRMHFLKQLVFCPANKNEDIKLIEKANQIIKEEDSNRNKIDKDCLFILKSFGQTFSSPFPRCSRQPNPVILKIFEYSSQGRENEENYVHRYCGPSNVNALEYGFGYQLCFKLGIIGRFHNTILKHFTKSKGFPLDDVEDYSIYHFCYDTRAKRTIYTKHRLSSPHLLPDPEIEQEREIKYQMDTDSFDLPKLEFTHKKTTYEKIDDSHLPQTENTTNRRIQGPFKIKTLVPAEDFSFALLRKTTFHWANTNLMHEKLIKYWDHINEFIRENAIKNYREFDMYTGAFMISPPGSDDLLTIEGIQIPQLWVKIIDNSYVERFKNAQYFKKYNKRVMREGVAIIANNYLNEKFSNLMLSNFYCEENLCRDFAKEEFKDVYMHIWCCAVTEKLMALYGIKLKFHKIYVIEGLIKINYKMPSMMNTAK